jgi:hypothetical protein
VGWGGAVVAAGWAQPTSTNSSVNAIAIRVNSFEVVIV